MDSLSNDQIVDSKLIISKYMDYVLENDGYPKSVYKFCKNVEIEEKDFYSFFSSLESLDKGIWTAFYETTIDVMYKNDEYLSFSNREKMLTFFFTFFELLTLNRSYVLFALKRYDVPFENLKQLKGLRRHVKKFASELIKEGNDEKQFKIIKNSETVYSEGAWLQFLFLLKFWQEDESIAFEKTDIAIEKSVNTIFDLFDNTPLTNVLDFGKFLWKEKMNWN
nr:TetR family transcriptional regulator C-terminal domain-containing protein [Aquimarina longa]